MYIAGLFIVFVIGGCVYILASVFKNLSNEIHEIPNSKVREVFTPGAVIKTYYSNNELDMIYTINKASSKWLGLSYYSPYSGKCLGQARRLITGLTEFEEKCEVYRDGLLVAVFERDKKPIFYGLNFKKKIKINIPELNEKHA